MRSYIETNRLYKDKYNRKVSGVCAGVARFLGVQPLYVRIAAVVSLIFLSVPTALAYLLAVILLPSR